MSNYPKPGDKVVNIKVDAPPRNVVKVNSEDDLIEIRTPDGSFGSHVNLEIFQRDYKKVDE